MMIKLAKHVTNMIVHLLPRPLLDDNQSTGAVAAVEEPFLTVYDCRIRVFDRKRYDPRQVMKTVGSGRFGEQENDVRHRLIGFVTKISKTQKLTTFLTHHADTLVVQAEDIICEQMWGGAERQRKRKAGSDPAIPKSWKGRVLLQNKTVKKSETSTRKVVWFSSTDAHDLAENVTALTSRVVCPDPIKARQCLDFELHFEMQKPFPPDVNLMVFAVLYKSDSGEEIKEGVVNNFSYIQRSQSHGVAVFEKLYLETRSQFSHYLEFTLWAERMAPPNANDPTRAYDRKTYYPIPGANTFCTPHFIPSTPSKKASNIHSEETEPVKANIEFLKMVPNKGDPGGTTYLTFSTRMRESSGQIFVVWNDQIIHLPYYTKGGSERIIVLEKIPPSLTEVVPVYLKEKPPQDSHVKGFTSNTLYFHYSTLSPASDVSSSDSAQFLTSRSNSAPFTSSVSPPTQSSDSQWSSDGPYTSSSCDRPQQRRRSFSTGGQPRQSTSSGHFSFQRHSNEEISRMDEDSSDHSFGPPKELSNLRISSPNFNRGNSSYSDSEDSGSVLGPNHQWGDPYKIKNESAIPEVPESVPNYRNFPVYPQQASPPQAHPYPQGFGQPGNQMGGQMYTNSTPLHQHDISTDPMQAGQIYQPPPNSSPGHHVYHPSAPHEIPNEQRLPQNLFMPNQNLTQGDKLPLRYSDPSSIQSFKERYTFDCGSSNGQWDQPPSTFPFDGSMPSQERHREDLRSRKGAFPRSGPGAGRLPPSSGAKTRTRNRHLSLPSQQDINHFFQNHLHKIDEEREFTRQTSKHSGEEQHDLGKGDSSHNLVDSFFL